VVNSVNKRGMNINFLLRSSPQKERASGLGKPSKHPINRGVLGMAVALCSLGNLRKKLKGHAPNTAFFCGLDNSGPVLAWDTVAMLHGATGDIGQAYVTPEIRG
jgi:hypothetical protein